MIAQFISHSHPANPRQIWRDLAGFSWDFLILCGCACPGGGPGIRQTRRAPQLRFEAGRGLCGFPRLAPDRTKLDDIFGPLLMGSGPNLPFVLALDDFGYEWGTFVEVFLTTGKCQDILEGNHGPGRSLVV